MRSPCLVLLAAISVGPLSGCTADPGETDDPTTGAGGSLGSGAGGPGGDATTGTGGDGGGGVVGVDPHPLYPALDLAELPGDGGGTIGPYQPPVLPTTSQSVSISSTGTQAGADLMAACQTPGTAVEVPSAAGAIGVVNFGNVDDCDVSLGADVVIDFLVVGSLPGPTHAPTHRLRVRGGQIGSMIVRGDSSDIVFDGVTINNGAVAPAQRSGSAIYLPDADGVPVERFAVVNSFIRMVAVEDNGSLGGCAFLSRSPRNVFFANNNVVTAGNNNSWGFRFSGGHNVLLVDNTVRVSFHKLVRLNDAPVDYVVIKGGVWMREETPSSTGTMNNDSFAQLSGSTTDEIYIHDPVVYLAPATPAAFGATSDPGQAGRSWEARNIEWHVRSPDVMSDDRLSQLEGFCDGVGGLCDYGVGTHTFTFDDALAFPEDPWRDLPTFDDDDPDHLPVL